MEASIDPVAGIEWLAGLFPVRAPRRGSLTVMFTDIAGFTAYAATCGDRAAARLVHRHAAAVQPAMSVKDRKSTRLNSSHSQMSYAVFCLKKTTTVDCNTV